MYLTSFYGIAILLLEITTSDTALLSPGKPTYQNTVGARGASRRAVDGNYEQHYGGNSCTHTGDGPNNWWMVDLGGNAKIYNIKIWNRSARDCCNERIDGARVYVDDYQCAQIHGSGSTFDIQCNGVVGRYIRVLHNNVITLCELEVHGDYTGEPGDENKYIFLLSGGKPTSQSNVAADGASYRAVDGEYAEEWDSGSCTHTSEGSNWWKVDLQRSSKVNNIVLYNRADCCNERLWGAQVYVDEHLCGSVPHDWQYFYVIYCGDFVGSTVKVVQNNALTLCELDVFGLYYVPPTDPPTDPPTEPPTEDDGECKDSDVTCPVLAKQGECPNSGISEKCGLSCNQCSCGDNFRNCAMWAEQGQCGTNRHFMTQHCRMSCELCECADKESHCFSWAKDGLCITDATRMLALCPISCNHCQCGDNAKDCSQKALGGECFLNAAYMMMHCARSCNQCGQCGDNPPYTDMCPTMAKAGNCATGQQTGFMMVNCPKSCEICEDDSDDDSDSDSDDEKEKKKKKKKKKKKRKNG